MIFPVAMYGLDHKEGQVPKNWCFQTVVLEKTLENPLDRKEIKLVSPKGNQPWIFIGRTDAEVEAPYFGHLMQRANSLGKTLILGNIEGKMRRGQQQMSWLDGTTNSVDVNLSKLQEMVMDREAWRATVHDVTKSWTQLSDWTTKIYLIMHLCKWPQIEPPRAFLGFPGGSDDKESPCSAGDPGSVPGLGRSPGEGNGYPFQYSCLENSMDIGDWWATVHGVAKSWTWLSD